MRNQEEDHYYQEALQLHQTEFAFVEALENEASTRSANEASTRSANDGDGTDAAVKGAESLAMRRARAVSGKYAFRMHSFLGSITPHRNGAFSDPAWTYLDFNQRRIQLEVEEARWMEFSAEEQETARQFLHPAQ